MDTTTKTQTAIPLEIVPANTNSQLVIQLDRTQRDNATKLVASNFLATMPDADVVLFGNAGQKRMGAALDNIVGELTKGGSPKIFALFQRLEKGVDDAKIPEIEKEIQDSLKTPGYAKFLIALGLSSVAKRAQGFNERIQTMLASKSTSLRDLMKKMETEITDEVNRLLLDVARMKRLAAEFRINIVEFGVYATAAREILINAKAELQGRKDRAANSNDPLEIEAIKAFEQRVTMFESRVLVLETIYVQAPAELQSIRLSEGAALSTLSETANSVLNTFNNIKSNLIQLAAAYQIQTVQQITERSTALNEQLTRHRTNVLGEVAVNAQKAVGMNRTRDAELLLQMATTLKDISSKVSEEEKNNQQRFEEARLKLGQVKALVSTIS